VYNHSIVTFIDILGFRDIVKNKNADEIDKILDIFNDFASSEDDEEASSYEPTCLSFSDSIVRVRNLDSDENIAYPIGHLFYEVNSLVHVQMNLINRGVLIRGGVSIGDARVAKNRIFGPAFVAAYEIESKFANYPRVVISPDLVNSLDTDFRVANENHTAEKEREYLRSQLAKGDDGLCFVDYLRASERELDDPDDYPVFLRKHKDLIVENGQIHSDLSATSSKYIWLSNYHNRVVSEKSDEYFERYDLKKSDFFISHKKIKSLSNI
jgi:hypothetical protein